MRKRLSAESRELEQLIDHAAHLVGAGLDPLQRVKRLGGRVVSQLIFEHAGEAVDRAQRGAQVVGDGVAESLEFAHGGFELRGPLPDPQLELGGQPAQLVLGTLALGYVPERGERRGLAFPVDRDDAHLCRPRGRAGDDVDLARLAGDERKAEPGAFERLRCAAEQPPGGRVSEHDHARAVDYQHPIDVLADHRPQTLLRDR